MNIFQNFSIRSRFNFITTAVIALILLVIIFFLLTSSKVSRYNQYNEEVNQLKIHYLNMRRYEQHFLLRYNEDPKFFIAGENIYIEKLKTTSTSISDLIINLSENSISFDLKLLDKLNEVEIIHQNYLITFNDLTAKTFKKGSYSNGITGDLKISGKKTYNSANDFTKNRISKMIEYSDNYLYTNDDKYYTAFLKEYEKSIKIPASIIEDSITNEQIIDNNSSGKFQSLLTGFKSNFAALVKINKELGVTYQEGLEGDLRNLKFKPLEELVQIVNQSKIRIEKNATQNIYIFFFIISLLFFILFWRFSNSIVLPLNRLRQYIKPLSLGVLPDKKLEFEGKNEISNITESVNELIDGLKETTSFALSIGQGEYSLEFKPLSENDSLGNALIEMRHNLILSRTDEGKRKQEDEIRTWTNVGLTKFNDILRQSQGNIKEMSVAVISDLVKFINANQGGIFVFNDDDDDRFLELTAAYAYGQEKKKLKTIYPGEGIVGTVAVEKETVYMTEIPETYITITSGLGDSKPRSLLIVPMIVEEEIVGVIELASFNKLKKHEIEFVETLSENIASSLSITKINHRTSVLFEQSQKQTELMKVQEEEMRQNFEELQQIQEESSRNSAEMGSILDAIDASSSVFNIDTSGEIISVNQQFLMLTDIPESKISGVHHKDFFTSTNDEEYNLFWEMLLSGENFQKSEHIKFGDIEFWFSFVYRPITDSNGKVVSIFSVGTNLTESKKLEQELKNNIAEINEAHKETERKQHILENTNEMMQANEKTLQSAVTNAMKQRKELAKKVEEVAEEEALTSSRLEGINQTNITIHFDLDGNIISVNKMFENIFGYKEESIKSKSITSLLSKDFTSSNEYSALWERLKAGKHVTGNFNFIGKEKQKIFMQGTFTALKNRKGKTYNIFLIGFDTTKLAIKSEELKARETELSIQIQEMKTLQDQSLKQQEELTIKSIEIAEKEADTKSRLDGINKTNIIIEFDKDRKITSANQEFTGTFGYTEKEALARNCQFIVPEEVQKSDKFRGIWEDLGNGKTVTDTFNFLNKKKQKIFVHGTFTPIKNTSGKTKNVILIGFEITELITKTEELKAREPELEFQLEDLKVAKKDLTGKTSDIEERKAYSKSKMAGINKTNIIIEFDKDRKIESANQKFTETFGYTEKEALARNCQFIVPEEVQKSDKFRGIWEDLGNGKTVTDTFNFLNKKKQKIFVYGTFTPIKDTSGKTKNVILIGFETTSLVMRTEELKARETELDFKMEELKELEKKQKKK